MTTLFRQRIWKTHRAPASRFYGEIQHHQEKVQVSEQSLVDLGEKWHFFVGKTKARLGVPDPDWKCA